MARPTSQPPADSSTLIVNAPTLFALGIAAERAGMGKLLEMDLVDLDLAIGLSPATATALMEIDMRGRVANLGELLQGAHPTVPRWKASRSAVAELFRGIKGLLLQHLAGHAETGGLRWQSRDDLEGWAQENGIRELLDFNIKMLPGLTNQALRDVASVKAGPATIADALFPDGFFDARFRLALGKTGPAALHDRAAKALVAWREELEASATDELDTLLAWPPPQAEPGVIRAGEQLLAMWGAIRPGLAHTFALPACERATCEIVPETVAAHFSMIAPPIPLSPERGSVRVVLSLETAKHACNCGAHRTAGSCAHVAAAILLLLRALHDQKGPLATQAGQLLGKPAWQRTLEALDDALRPATTEAAGTRVVWRLKAVVGNLSLQPYLQKRSATRTGWSSGTRLDWYDSRTECRKDDRDRRVLAALSGGSAYYGERSVATIGPALLELCGHDLVFMSSAANSQVHVQQSELTLRGVERGEEVELVAEVAGRQIPPARVVAGLDEGGGTGIAALLEEAERVCHVVRVPVRAEKLLRAIAGRTTTFPADAIGALLERVEPIQAAMPLQLPPSMLGREVEPAGTVVLRLERAGGSALEVQLLVRPVGGGIALVPGEGIDVAAGSEGEERIFARRRFVQELAAARAIRATLAAPGEDLGFVVEGDDALDLLGDLAAREPRGDLVIEWPKEKLRVTRQARASDMKLEVTQQRDWFGLNGGLQVDGVSVELALALDAVRRGSRYVEAEAGVFVALADELREALARAAEQVHVGRKGIEVSLGAVPSIEALVEDGSELEAVRSFRELVGRIRASRDFEAPLPAGLQAELRPYQIEGFRWMARLAAWGAGGCLADDMGLGKTLQTLALLLHRVGSGPALVVAPTSVCGGWVREAERFAPSLRTIVYGTLAEAERASLELGPGDVLIVSYGLLTRDIERLASRPFATFVLDEAQAIKNPQTDRAQAARRIDAEIRVALSGTPLENHLGELWSLYRVALPGLLGSADQFRARFALPIERDRDPARRAALAAVLRPFLLRRTKSEVASDLPARSEIDVAVELSAAERRLYDEARLAAAARVAGLDGSVAPEQRRFEILAAITRLRLCACHPRLYDQASQLASSKTKRLVETLAELRGEGHRALVFSQFTKHLDLVQAAIGEEGITCLRLDGSTPAAKRQGLVDAWQAGEGDAFLISLKAGGTGLNLTGADYVIHLDPWWNPAVEDQATDRAHRIGQTRPVTVLRLVARGTIEEQILALHAQKRELLATVLDGVDGGVRVDAEALISLLEAGPAEVAEDEPEEAVLVGAEGAPEEAILVGDEGAPARGASVPACLAVGDLESLVEAFRNHLEEEHEAGRIGRGTVDGYPRVVERFVAFLGAGRAVDLQDAPFSALRARYLAEVRSGAWPAPKSEPTFGATALNRLGQMLASWGA